MQFIEVASQTIPGFQLLNETQQNAFKETKVGLLFSTFVNKFCSLANATASTSASASWIPWNYLFSRQEDKEDFGDSQDDFCRERKELLTAISETDDYKQLIESISYKILEDEYSDFSYLTTEQKSFLAAAEFSKTLQSRFLPALLAYKAKHKLYSDSDDDDGKLEFDVKKLEKDKNEIFAQWYKAFCESETMAPLRTRIAQERAPARARELARHLPILNRALPSSRRTLVEEYQQAHNKESGEKIPDFVQMEEVFLSSLLSHHFQQATVKRIADMNLQGFNQEEATRIAKKIQLAIAKRQGLNMASWLDEYEENLRKQILKKLREVNGKVREVVAKAVDENGMLASLSYYFWSNKAVNKVSEAFVKYADAHAFIQYTGLSTQNESSFLAFVDIFNYYRAADQISETRSIVFSLLMPFLPLYQEYKEISLYEKNVFRKIFRALMPLIVIAGVVVLIAAALAPLGIPELAFLIVAIPSLFLGAFLASKYVTWKNELFQYLRNKYYGGPYEIPEFQINERMRQVFGQNEELAEVIKGIYLDELRACDELEQSYQERGDQALLTEEELKSRKNNSAKRFAIQLEWYDIHSNEKLGIDLVANIVDKRLNELANEAIKSMDSEIEKHDAKNARRYARDITNELRAVFAPGTEKVQRTSNTDRRASSSQNSVTESSGIRFFKAQSTPYQEKAARMDNALELLQQSSIELLSF